MEYLNSILASLLFFPFIALVFTFPFMIHEYRKYGSIPGFRIAIIYSFILYLMCAYFLVILPLPDRETVALLTTPRVQLIPFSFVADIIKNIDIHNLKTIIVNKAVFQSFFNIVLTIPFGIYLHYYFKTDMKKTVLYTFLLSLFFELTQLSGLYFVYPRGYRLFDVDDLMLNTVGGYIGYELSLVIGKTLPSRKKIDEQAYVKGQKVSFMRRILAYTIDMAVILFIFGITSTTNIALDDYLQYVISIALYYIILPTFTHGKTLGFYATGLKIVRGDNSRALLLDYLLRYGLLFLVFLPLPSYLEWIFGNNHIFSILIVVYYIFIVIHGFKYLTKDKPLWYESISKTKVASSVLPRSDKQ